MTPPRLPRLLDAALHERCRLFPTALVLEMRLTSPSTASMELPPDAPAVALGDLMELYTASGSAGIFRVEQAERNASGAARLTLVHGLITLQDHLSPTPDDAPVTTTLHQAMAELLAQQTTWQLGDVANGEALLTWRCEQTDLLTALMALVQTQPAAMLVFDQTALPWTLHLRSFADDDPCECRLTRNLRSLTMEEDRSQLCTRLLLPGQRPPLEADTLSLYGPVTRAFSADPALTEDELLSRARFYLDQHRHPALTITLEAIELCRLTGSSLDHFRLGVPCRVCLPEQNTALTQRVTALHWPDVLRQPDALRITLASTAATASSLLSTLIVDSTAIRKQVYRQWEQLSNQQDLLIQAENSITLHAQHIALKADKTVTDGLATRISNAEIGIDGANAAIALKADRSVTDALGQRLSSAEVAIDGANAAIALKAEKSVTDDLGQRLSSAEVAIDGANAAIALKAEKSVTDDLGQRLSSAEVAIDGANAAIALKAEKSVTDDLGQRLSSAEVTIDGANAAIALKAEKSVTDDLGTRMRAAEIAIDGANSAIELKADKISLNGYTTLKKFEALEGTVDEMHTDWGNFDALSANSITCGTGDFDALVFGTFAGRNGSWKTAEVLTGGYNSTATTSIPIYSSAGTLVGSATVLTKATFIPTTATITYFGAD